MEKEKEKEKRVSRRKKYVVGAYAVARRIVKVIRRVVCGDLMFLACRRVSGHVDGRHR